MSIYNTRTKVTQPTLGAFRHGTTSLTIGWMYYCFCPLCSLFLVPVSLAAEPLIHNRGNTIYHVVPTVWTRNIIAIFKITQNFKIASDYTARFIEIRFLCDKNVWKICFERNWAYRGCVAVLYP